MPSSARAPLPASLAEAIGAGQWKGLASVHTETGTRVSELMALAPEQMQQETASLCALADNPSQAGHYGLTTSDDPEDDALLAPASALVIAINYDEQALVLDYRHEPARLLVAVGGAEGLRYHTVSGGVDGVVASWGDEH